MRTYLATSFREREREVLNWVDGIRLRSWFYVRDRKEILTLFKEIGDAAKQRNHV